MSKRDTLGTVNVFIQLSGGINPARIYQIFPKKDYAC
jgi:hypothetical protein